LSRILAAKRLGGLAEASFCIFALQMPVGVWVTIPMLRLGLGGSTLHLAAMITATLGASILWAEFVQRRWKSTLRPKRTVAAKEAA
jgi:peptidoglycan/LPS O-acetylase OafA/YrhL